MTKLVHREIIAAKAEVTYNTDPVPTAAANGILVENLSWSHAGLKMAKRPAIRASSAPLQELYAGSLRQIDFEVAIKGSGTAGTAPEFDPLLQACGFAVTTVALTSNTYAPISTPSSQASVTIYYYEDGSLVKITGARGKMSIDLKSGDIGKMKFTMIGHWSAMTDVALPTASYLAAVPPALVGLSPKLAGTYTPVVENIKIDMGQQVEMPPSIGASDGYGDIILGARGIKGSIDPQADTVANFPFLGDFTGGTLFEIDTGVIGSSAGNKYQITMPKCYFDEVKPGNRNTIRTYECSFMAVENATDDDISIAFT